MVGPREFTTSHCTIDARPGGQWLMSAQEYGMTDDMPSDDRVTVTLEEQNGRTRMTMRQGIPPDVAERNGAPQGWRETFDKLDSYLSHLQRGEETVH